ncbi:hypothetical protein [Archangium lipolyticum]|uniref:hypothetical protein n=1 Tax=Archangium lipolyticum TaxID=2970465 RepID=UPI00214AAC67|nr:hypothetical protein [Archangium lipolyticum]
MTSTLLVLLLLSQAEGPDNPPDGVDLAHLDPAPDGMLRPGAFASLGLGVDHAR